MSPALESTRGSWAAIVAAGTAPVILRPRDALRRVVLFLGLLAAAGSGFSADFAGSVILGRPAGTSMAASILAPTALTVYLEYGTKAGSYPAQTTPAALAANLPLELELTSLQPNTRYYYRLRFRAPTATTYEASPEYSFMTQRPPGSTFRFDIQGDAPKQLLIRAVGPTLSGFGVGGVLADPQLTIYREGSTTPVQQNDNWITANAGQIGLAAAQVGAFALPANSRDAALLVTLAPGTYTAQVSGVGNTTGVALVEIYEVP